MDSLSISIKNLFRIHTHKNIYFFKTPIFTFFSSFLYFSFFFGRISQKQQFNLSYRYYEKDSQINDQHQQQIKSHHNKYEFDLERDHALPTSAPNADILKSNNNPTYPNPNRHHNHNHRHQNATPSPQGNDYVSIQMFFP
jgi:hypothetical protein